MMILMIIIIRLGTEEPKLIKSSIAAPSSRDRKKRDSERKRCGTIAFHEIHVGLS